MSGREVSDAELFARTPAPRPVRARPAAAPRLLPPPLASLSTEAHAARRLSVGLSPSGGSSVDRYRRAAPVPSRSPSRIPSRRGSNKKRGVGVGPLRDLERPPTALMKHSVRQRATRAVLPERLPAGIFGPNGHLMGTGGSDELGSGMKGSKEVGRIQAGGRCKVEGGSRVGGGSKGGGSSKGGGRDVVGRVGKKLHKIEKRGALPALRELERPPTAPDRPPVRKAPTTAVVPERLPAGFFGPNGHLMGTGGSDGFGSGKKAVRKGKELDDRWNKVSQGVKRTGESSSAGSSAGGSSKIATNRACDKSRSAPRTLTDLGPAKVGSTKRPLEGAEPAGRPREGAGPAKRPRVKKEGEKRRVKLEADTDAEAKPAVPIYRAPRTPAEVNAQWGQLPWRLGREGQEQNCHMKGPAPVPRLTEICFAGMRRTAASGRLGNFDMLDDDTAIRVLRGVDQPVLERLEVQNPDRLNVLDACWVTISGEKKLAENADRWREAVEAKAVETERKLAAASSRLRARYGQMEAEKSREIVGMSDAARRRNEALSSRKPWRVGAGSSTTAVGRMRKQVRRDKATSFLRNHS